MLEMSLNGVVCKGRQKLIKFYSNLIFNMRIMHRYHDQGEFKRCYLISNLAWALIEMKVLSLSLQKKL